MRNITRNNFSLGLRFIEPQKSEELKAHSVEALDIVITKMGDPPGDCQIYPAGSPKAVLTADCLKLRVWPDFIEREFIKFCIWSNHIKKQLGLITKGVAQKKLALIALKQLFYHCLLRKSSYKLFCVQRIYFHKLINLI